VSKELVVARTKEFGNLLKQGVEAIFGAAKIYAEDVKKNPDVRVSYRESFSMIPEGWWSKYEKIGNGIMSPKMLLPPKNANFITRFSHEEQEECLNAPIEVLLPSGGTALKISLENLTPLQCRQVFAYDHVRTLPEQRAILESDNTQKVIVHMKKKEEKYFIIKDKLRVTGECEFTRKELERILLQEF
jgi:hypothetical protein